MVQIVPVHAPPLPPSRARSPGPTRDHTTHRSSRKLSTFLVRTSHLLKGTTDAIIVQVDRRTFLISWALLLLARAACILYCLGAASAMLVLHHPFMLYYAELLQPGLRPMLPAMAALYVVVAATHAVQVARTVLTTIRSQQQSLETRTASSSRTGSFPSGTRAIHRVWRLMFSRRGFFGVESKYYEARYVVRETVEIVSQSVQAYTSSVLIGSLWINNVYIAIVVFNCLSTPIIQRLTRRFHWSVAQERLACVVVDTLLDAGTAIVLPAVLVYPYIRDLDLVRHTFDVELLYNDVWFIGLIYENRQVFPLSVPDLALKFFPQVSLLLSISSIGSILRLRPVVHDQPIASATTATVRNKLHHTKSRLSRFHSYFVVWGLVLLTCHVVAVALPYWNGSFSLDGCKQQLRPWFVLKSACTVYDFNCYRHKTESMDDVAGGGVLESLDATSLAVLIVSHCPALRVSPSIQRFSSLVGVEIYNSTLVEWSEDAALTSSTHPVITYAFLIRTNLTGIPRGLLSPNIPPTLMDIEFSATNLSSVPPNLHETWQRVTTLYIEHSQLQTLPETILRMKLDDFSAIDNGITQLPDFSISPGNYFMLALAENPIASLPPSLGQLQGVGFLNLVGTKLASLPHWMDMFADASSRVFVSDTPFCETKSVVEIHQQFGVEAKISCAYTDGRVRSRYPLDLRSPFLE